MMSRYRAELSMLTQLQKTPFSITRIAIQLGLVWAISASSILTPCVADEEVPFEKRGIEDRIQQLIRQLDDRSFANRENAAQELAQIGVPALRFLALSVFEGSPEAVWRTRTTLETIGTHGDEEVFYKSAGILQLLFSDSGESLRPKILQLQQEWKLERKRNILKQLVQLGAIVSDPRTDQVAFDDGLPIVFRNNVVINGPVGVLEFQDGIVDSPSNTTGRQSFQRRTDLDSENAIREIDQILLATLEQNRELVLGHNFAAPESDDDAAPQLNANAVQRQIAIQRLQRQIALDNMMQRRFVNQPLNNAGISISLGRKWTGTASDLAPLQSLDGLGRIELLEINLDRPQLDVIADLPFQMTLKVQGNQISDADLAVLSGMPELRSLEFADRDVSSDLLKQFADSNSLLSCSFSNCELSADSLLNLRKIETLGGLYFGEMQIDASIFKALEQLSNLNYLSLRICKFETASYRRLEMANPNLQIAFTPQAFLGVRGPMNLTRQQGCEISEVIPESGASKAGLEIGDVIEKVNGQVIERFEDLRLHIAQHKAGESLKVEITRDGQPMKVNVVLGRYDTNLE